MNQKEKKKENNDFTQNFEEKLFVLFLTTQPLAIVYICANQSKQVNQHNHNRSTQRRRQTAMFTFSGF